MLPHGRADQPSRGTGALIALVRAYRALVAPLLPPSCRFAPSCSAYAIGALERFGPARGLALALARVAHCHPWHVGGHDPVPDSRV